MSLIIDAHEDLAYNMLCFGRDYRRPVAETRRLEVGALAPTVTGNSLIGWPEYQKGQVGLVFATLFTCSERHSSHTWDSQHYRNLDEAGKLLRSQVDLYRRLAGEHPDMFRLIFNRKDLADALAPWDQSPADYPDITHPVGLVLLMEGAEGIREPAEMEEWWEMGVRIVGPVWAGGRFCGGTLEPGSFTGEGRELLEIMASLGFTLDIAHMNEESAHEALDLYEGRVIASHANARALLKGAENERHLSDRVIRQLIERGGVMGAMPVGPFLRLDFDPQDPRRGADLDMLAAHIDHVCQIAGNAEHVGIGSDFDGGFGREWTPVELDSIADLPKIGVRLSERGYSPEDVDAILQGNWRRMLERNLPE